MRKIKNRISALTLLLFFLLGMNNISGQQPNIDKTKSKQNSGELKSWILGAPPNQTNRLWKKNDGDRGNVQYLRKGLHSGNLVESAFLNRGQLSDGYHGQSFPMNWPRGEGVMYGFLFDFFVAAEVVTIDGDTIHVISDCFKRGDVELTPDGSHWYFWQPLPGYFNDKHKTSSDYYIGGISEDVGIDGYPNTNDEGEGNNELDPGEDFNTNGILDLDLTNVLEYPAMSHAPETWPTYWPSQSYPGDDRAIEENRAGVRAGRWNGEFGTYIRGDQESYYVMDDSENDEFEYYPFEDSLSALPWPDGRRGLGLTVEVRNYQWNHPLAEDIIISRYNIINYGKKIDKAVVGMYSDVDVGGSLSNDDADYDTIDDITYVWEKSGLANNGRPTGYFGFAFLESPGLEENQKDDDDDGMIDESQNNEIDEDGDWRPWEDSNNNGVYDNEDINYNGELDVGEDINGNGELDIEPINDDVGSDGLGPEDDGYPGPDANMTEANNSPDDGEPNYGRTDNDEIDQVGLTSWYLKDVDNRLGNDEQFWKVELQPGNFGIDDNYARDVAFTYGSGFIPLLTGRDKFQRYAIACLFGKDEQDIFRNKRTMQKIYDLDYSFTKPPRKPVLTAIPGDKRVVLLWDSRAEKSRDPIYGRDFEAYKIYRSTEPYWNEIKTITDAWGNPLLHESIAIFDLNDGLKGPHPVEYGVEGEGYGALQDMGRDSGLKHSYVDTLVDNGRTYYYAVVSMDMGYNVDFPTRGLSDREGLAPIFPSECSAVIQTDALGRPTFIDKNCAVITPVEAAAGYEVPHLDGDVKHSEGSGSGNIKVEILIDSETNTDHTYQVAFTDDGSFDDINVEDAENWIYTGLTNGAYLIDITESNDTLMYFDNLNNDIVSDHVFDGFHIFINNSNSIRLTSAEWTEGNSNIQLKGAEGDDDIFTGVPRDYEIRILDFGADTSYAFYAYQRKVSNFQVWDVTDPENEFKVAYEWIEGLKPDSLKGLFATTEQITIREKPKAGIFGGVSYEKKLWHFVFGTSFDLDSSFHLLILPEKGDVFKITSNKPLDRNDKFEFTIVGNEFSDSKARNDLDDIFVVPDPYIAANTLEPRLIRQVGRGQRRVDFVNLPPQCKISIFTMSGQLVQEIDHDSPVESGREPWDMRTKDGLEVSFGVYIYHVEAPGIGEKIGRFAIIK